LRVQEPRTWTERARQGSSLLGFWHLRGFVCARVGVSREPSTPKRARPSSFSPRAPVSQHLKTLGSFRRGALPLQSLHLLTRPGIPAGRTHLSFRRPVSASEREPLPSRGGERSSATSSGSALGLSQPLGGLRKRTFHGLISCRSQFRAVYRSRVPLAEIACPSAGRLAPLRFLTCVPDAASRTLSPPVSLHQRAPHAFRRAPAKFPWRLWTPFPSTSPSPSRLPWIRKTVVAFTAGLVPFEALIPLRVRSRVVGLPQPLGRSSTLVPLQRPTDHDSEPRTRLQAPEGTWRHALPARRLERAARGTRSPSTGRDRAQKTTRGQLGRHQHIRSRGIFRAGSGRPPRGEDARPLRIHPRGRWAAPPLGGDSFPSDLSPPREAELGLWGFGVRSQRRLSRSPERTTRTSCLS